MNENHSIIFSNKSIYFCNIFIIYAEKSSSFDFVFQQGSDIILLYV